MIKLNGLQIKPTIFPDKTSQVWRVENLSSVPNDLWVDVQWLFENEAEFLHLAQLVDLISYVYPNAVINLDLPYLPYGRQDKEITNESTFALRSFAKLLNTLDVFSVSTIDAHSELAEHIVHKLYNHSPKEYIDRTINLIGPDHILFPDAGAKLRYEEMLLPTMKLGCIQGNFCKKIRDQQTGEILGLEFENPATLIDGDSVLIVDDLCDGGRTFIEVAKKLKELGITEINLYTTHGIYSKGTDVLRDAGIDRIFNYKGEVL